MGTPKLILLPPRAVLDLDGLHPAPSIHLVTRALSRMAPGRDVDVTLRALAEIFQRDASWSLPSLGLAETETRAASSELTEQQREYDHYFGVVRKVGPERALIFCEAILTSYHQFLKGCTQPHGLLPLEINAICSALESLLYLFAPDPEPVRSRPAADGTGASEEAPFSASADVDPLERWRSGHHVFFVLVQGLIIVHARLARALASRDVSGAHEALALATELWLAAAASFHFAGNFSSTAYSEVVRPSMEPPHVSAGFSGLAFADHAVLIKQLRTLAPRLEQLPAALRAPHRRYLWAFNAMYEMHGCVCATFVEDGQSLRRMALPSTGQVDGPALIRGALKRRVFQAHPKGENEMPEPVINQERWSRAADGAAVERGAKAPGGIHSPIPTGDQR